MATLTSTFYANTPKALHAGLNVIRIDYAHTLSVSAGDVILLAKLPNGARCFDLVEEHSTAASSCSIDLGLSRGTEVGGGASVSAFITAGAQATQNRRTVRGIPPLVSTSDNDPEKWGVLSAKIAAISTSTAGFKLSLQFAYTVDDNLT